MVALSKEDPRLRTLANIALTHSLKLPDLRKVDGKRQLVTIIGEPIVTPMVLALQSRITEMGHYAGLRMFPSGWGRQFIDLADDDQIAYTASSAYDSFRNSDCFISIRGPENPKEMEGADSKRMQKNAAAKNPFTKALYDKPWILLPFPTPGSARLAGVSLQTFTDFLFRATNVDYVRMRENQRPLAEAMNAASVATIRTTGPKGKVYELNIPIDGMYAVNHPGEHNIPDGEVFTSPNVKSKRPIEGQIFVQDRPCIIGGQEVWGIYLRFEKGRVVDYHAQKGQEHLDAILKTDEGAKSLGEIAVGTNMGVDRITKDMLFDEKEGNTSHIALGRGFKESLTMYPSDTIRGRRQIEEALKSGRGYNESAVHADIVTGPLTGKNRGLYLDGKRVVRKGQIYIVQAA